MKVNEKMLEYVLQGWTDGGMEDESFCGVTKGAECGG